MWIKDLLNDTVREYGKDCHDSLRISEDGKMLEYQNLQNGLGSWDRYRFVTEDGKIPQEDKIMKEQGAAVHFNIGGWDEDPAEPDPEIVKKAAVLDQLVKELNDPRNFKKMLDTTLRILHDSGYLAKRSRRRK